MLIKQFVDENLGNASYLVASEETRQAILIDAERDVDRYVRIAEGLGLQLTHALDTHLHADFVSGAHQLAAEYGITAGASADSSLAFDYLRLNDGDTLSLGDVKLLVLATPGHTPEHISFAAIEEDQVEPTALFTGGALIVGGAARTDLLGHHFTRPLTHLLYETIHQKLLRYPDHVAVYPTHGGGSFCNVPSSSERVSTIGRERQSNPLAMAQSEEEFVANALDNLPSYPMYFNYLRAVNQLGPEILHGIPALKSLTPHAVSEQMTQGVAVVDTRSPLEFADGHLPNSYGIPLVVSLGTWAGWILPFRSPIILIADDPASREDAVRQLIRTGYDDLRGYLDGGIAAWRDEGFPVTKVKVLSVNDVHSALQDEDGSPVLDVRQDAEWRAGHLPGAIHIEGGRLPFVDLHLPQDGPVTVHCHQAYRATVALSVLERREHRDLQLMYGGFSAWQAAGLPITREK
jgi:hydroxyacylglutathione hydrolase